MSDAVILANSIELTDEFAITKKFRNANEFSLFIEEKIKGSKLTYLEMVLEYCKEEDIDPESIKSLIGPALKDKIRVDAEEANLIKKRARLSF